MKRLTFILLGLLFLGFGNTKSELNCFYWQDNKLLFCFDSTNKVSYGDSHGKRYRLEMLADSSKFICYSLHPYLDIKTDSWNLKEVDNVVRIELASSWPIGDTTSKYCLAKVLKLR